MSLISPDSELSGSYLPSLKLSSDQSLQFAFGLSDLYKARYSEAWLPSNFPYDQYSTTLQIGVTNSINSHSIITNGKLSEIGFNKWLIDFPSNFSSMSPLLEIWPSNTLENESKNVSLPISNKDVTIEVWKLKTSPIRLNDQIDKIENYLVDNEKKYGEYIHGDRFVASFNGIGGMEYDGGTTTSTSALLHEIFHSWFARGIKPASHSDGWYDEGFTAFHDEGADDEVPLNFPNLP